MKKVTLAVLILLFLTSCAYPQKEVPKPMEPNPVTQDKTDITVDQPKEPVESAEEVPVFLDELPISITIRNADSIGTIYMDATYKNNSKFPIVGYMMTVLLKDKNEKVRLSNFDTVLPGETSPKFDTFGPNTKNINDIEKLTLEIVAMTENNKKLYIDYDFKLGIAEWFYEQ